MTNSAYSSTDMFLCAYFHCLRYQSCIIALITEPVRRILLITKALLFTPSFQDIGDEPFRHELALHRYLAVFFVQIFRLHEKEVEPAFHQLAQVQVRPDGIPQLISGSLSGIDMLASIFFERQSAPGAGSCPGAHPCC